MVIKNSFLKKVVRLTQMSILVSGCFGKSKRESPTQVLPEQTLDHNADSKTQEMDDIKHQSASEEGQSKDPNNTSGTINSTNEATGSPNQGSGGGQTGSPNPGSGGGQTGSPNPGPGNNLTKPSAAITNFTKDFGDMKPKFNALSTNPNLGNPSRATVLIKKEGGNWDGFLQSIQLGLSPIKKVVTVNAANEGLTGGDGIDGAHMELAKDNFGFTQIASPHNKHWDATKNPSTNSSITTIKAGEFAISKVADVSPANTYKLWAIYHACGIKGGGNFASVQEIYDIMYNLVKSMLERANTDGTDIFLLPAISCAIFANAGKVANGDSYTKENFIEIVVLAHYNAVVGFYASNPGAKMSVILNNFPIT